MSGVRNPAVSRDLSSSNRPPCYEDQPASYAIRSWVIAAGDFYSPLTLNLVPRLIMDEAIPLLGVRGGGVG